MTTCVISGVAGRPVLLSTARQRTSLPRVAKRIQASCAASTQSLPPLLVSNHLIEVPAGVVKTAVTFAAGRFVISVSISREVAVSSTSRVPFSESRRCAVDHRAVVSAGSIR